MVASKIDYSRWDQVDDDEPKDVHEHSVRVHHHNASMNLIAKWLQAASQTISNDEVLQMVQFIAAQHRGKLKDNRARGPEIIALLKGSSRPPSCEPLVVLAGYTRARSLDETLEQEERTQASRVLDIALCALNTLHACETEGGAPELFRKLTNEPGGEVARRYEALDYAKARLVAAAPQEEPRFSWRKAILFQFVSTVLSVSLAYAFIARQGSGYPAGLLPPAAPSYEAASTEEVV
mmetsp:Transcript_33309/g.55059  ORF Transcript_33309/g.55059 Transcript_33309/m.55059 type:complete len:236 (-) Transcript_33309:97-804(-)